MSQPLERPRRFSMPRPLRRLAAALCVGGTAAVLWLEEIMLYAEEILALIFLPIAAGILYLFDILAFKAHTPTRED